MIVRFLRYEDDFAVAGGLSVCWFMGSGVIRQAATRIDDALCADLTCVTDLLLEH